MPSPVSEKLLPRMVYSMWSMRSWRLVRNCMEDPLACKGESNLNCLFFPSLELLLPPVPESETELGVWQCQCSSINVRVKVRILWEHFERACRAKVRWINTCCAEALGVSVALRTEKKTSRNSMAEHFGVDKLGPEPQNLPSEASTHACMCLCPLRLPSCLYQIQPTQGHRRQS